jgi:hypothetical protein
MMESGKTLNLVRNDERKSVAHRGSRDSAEWALEMLRMAGVEATLADDPDGGGNAQVHVLVDVDSLTRAEELLRLATDESRRRIDVITAGLRRSAIRGLVPALVMAGVELGLNRRPLPDLLPWLVLVWGVAFVWFARRDHGEHWRGRGPAARPMR